MEQQTLIVTQDMGLAIALIATGYELFDLEGRPSSKRITFRFKKLSRINEKMQDYWNGNLQVDAKTYWNESKNLKTRLYSL